MLMGYGGNVGVSIGDDGVFLIDDQYSEQVGPLKTALAALSAEPVRFLINTHWHSDHTGGNEKIAKTGAMIIAHDNVRKRLASDQVIAFFKAQRPAAPPSALPIVTFTQELSFYLNGEEIIVTHVENAHTDGDAMIYFKNANVIHMGDVFFNELYPFIDVGSGGSSRGVLAAIDQALAHADDDTRIIPGHGALSDKKGLIAYRQMLETVRSVVADLIVAGNTEAQIVAAKPTADFDATWGNGFLKPDRFVKMMYDSLRHETLQ